MPRGYRLLFATLGLVLASPSYSQETKHDQAKPGGNGTSQLERIASAVEKIPRATAPDDGCQPGQDNRQSDLCAQWKAADAAAESANWTFWTFIASLIGLSVGAGTLIAAWLAARWAKKAADYTETGAKAATDAVKETKRIGEAQVRCYLSADSARVLQIADDNVVAYCTVKNYGSSPARHVRVEATMSAWHGATKEGVLFEMLKHEQGYFYYNIPIGKEVEIGPISLKLPDDPNSVLSRSDTMITLRVTVYFEDVFEIEGAHDARFDAVSNESFRARKIIDMDRTSDIKLKEDTANDDSRNRTQ